MINTRRITLATLVAAALAIGVAAQPQGDPQKARPRTTTPMTEEQNKKVQTPLTSSDGLSAQASSSQTTDRKKLMLSLLLQKLLQ